MTENKLEATLREAATDEAARAEFYQELIRSEIFIVGSTGQNADGEGPITLKAGSSLDIASFPTEDGEEIIPFFTSLTAMRKMISAEQSYVALPAESFFEITSGARLVLNPGSDYGKEFTPYEISMIMGNPDPALNVRTEVVSEATDVLIGQPKIVPTRLLNALAAAFPAHPEVSRAWLARIARQDGTANLVIGIESEKDASEIVRSVSGVIDGKIPDGQPLDFMRVDPSEPEAGLSSYFLGGVRPFYTRGGALSGGSKKPFWKFWA